MQRMWDLVHALDVRSKRMARMLGVTGPQRLVVRMIGQVPGISATEIATALGMHPSTLTGIVKRLVAQGLIQRAADETDRRRARFQLTPAGLEVNREHRGTVEAAVRRALGRAGRPTIDRTNSMIDLLVAELSRGD